MKNKLLSFFFLASTVTCLHAQINKFDYQWLMGHQEEYAVAGFAHFILDFNDGMVSVDSLGYTGDPSRMGRGESMIGDSAGHLAAFTNGCSIFGPDRRIMPNGDEINPGSTHELHCDLIEAYSLPDNQGSVILPWPDSAHTFFMLHYPYVIDIIQGAFQKGFVPLSYSVFYADGVQDTVLVKNQVLLQDTIFGGTLTAVRHANGRDWWIPVNLDRTNIYHTFLLGPDGITDTVIQQIGLPGSNLGHLRGQTKFSPDGSRYIRFNTPDGMYLYDFDRTTGELSNFEYLPGSGVLGGAGMEFSPSGRFLYTAEIDTLWQYDLEAVDWPASKTLVAVWDGLIELNLFYANFGRMQRGPDCRIYVSPLHYSTYMHVIPYPDQKAPACGFFQRGIKVPVLKEPFMPHFPNYRLGSEPSYPCDSTIAFVPYDPTSVASVQQPIGRLEVAPNPAAQWTRVVWGLPRSGQLAVLDLYGRVVHQQVIRQQSEVVLELSGLASGMYSLLFVEEGTGARWVGKVVKGE